MQGTNPKEIIRNYFATIRAEIKACADEFLAMDYRKRMRDADTFRQEVGQKCELMLNELGNLEKSCIHDKSERQFVRIANELSKSLANMWNSSAVTQQLPPGEFSIIMEDHQFLDDDTAMSSAPNFARLLKEIFMNRSTMFVKNVQSVKTPVFGHLVVLEFFLPEDLLNSIK